MRYEAYFIQTAIAPLTVKDKITKYWDSFGSHCIQGGYLSSFQINLRNVDQSYGDALKIQLHWL
jgi:hypothetical protein